MMETIDKAINELKLKGLSILFTVYLTIPDYNNLIREVAIKTYIDSTELNKYRNCKVAITHSSESYIRGFPSGLYKSRRFNLRTLEEIER